MYQANFSESYNIITSNTLHCKKCTCDKFDSSFLIQKLKQILHALEQQIKDKNKEVQRLKLYYQNQIKQKDIQIHQLQGMNKKLEGKNNDFKKQLQKQKERTSSMTINIHEINQNKTNISQLITLDNSVKNRVEVINETIKSLEKQIKKVSRNMKDYSKCNMSGYKGKNGEGINYKGKNHGKKEEYSLKRVRSSGFIGKNTYDYFTILPHKRMAHQKVSSQNDSLIKYNIHKPKTSESHQNMPYKNNFASIFVS